MTYEQGDIPQANRPASRVSVTVALMVIIVIAAWIRSDQLTDRELWFDESCTFYAVNHLLDWPADGPDPQRELAHIPYFFLLHAWTRLTGETAWGLRSFSALMGVLGVLALGAIGHKLGGRRVALATAALAALNPLHVYYSQEARVYTMWVVEMSLALLLLYQAARMQGLRWWIAYCVVVWITVATHYYTLLWLPATATAALIAKNRSRFARQWLIAHVVLAVCLLPLAYLLIIPLAQGGPKMWLREMWLSYRPALAIPKSLWAMLPSGGYPSYLGSLTGAAEVAAGNLGQAFGLVSLWGATAVTAAVILTLTVTSQSGSVAKREGIHVVVSDSDDESTHRLQVALFLFGSVLAFLLFAFAYSLLAGPKYIVARYDLAAWPAITLGLAMLVDVLARRCHSGQLQRSAICATITAMLLACSMTTLAGARSVHPQNSATERARRIASAVASDDLVISMAMYRWFMTYEWHQLEFRPHVVSFPQAHDRQLCWDNPEAELADQESLAADIASVTERIHRSFADGRRVWLLAHGDPTGPRWPVDSRFFAALHASGIDIQLHDEWAGLAQLTSRGQCEQPTTE
ncbi:MAG: glycosyltransferase family 39 protein [Phycisphaerales bacterium]|nr:MAG: glycosyltransferase family 39 protein [Phycisphaerales bacterium]